MRKNGGFITFSPPATTTALASGHYESFEADALKRANNKWPVVPSITYTLTSNSGYGVDANGTAWYNRIYPNTSFYWNLSFTGLSPNLVNSTYYIVTQLTAVSKGNSPTASGSQGNSTYNFHSNNYDYDILERRSLLNTLTNYVTPSFLCLWNWKTSDFQHQVSWYIVNGSNTAVTDSTYSYFLGSATIYRGSFVFNFSWSSSSVQEGVSVNQYIYSGTNGRNSSSATIQNVVGTSGGTAVAADMPSSFTNSLTVVADGTTLTTPYAPVSDGLTEGSETFYYRAQAYCSATATYTTLFGDTLAFTITDPPSAPSYVTAGNKTPLLGGTSTGASYPYSASWTGLQSASVDDGSVAVPLGFNFYIANGAYSTAYVGSNTYITFGSGSSNYSGLSSSNPNLPKFQFGSSDNSYQRVQYRQSPTAGQWCKIRYEGNGSTSGTVGTPGIVLEITLYSPSFLGTTSYVCEVLIGVHNRTGGQWGVADPNTYYSTGVGYAANSSYVFVGNSTGTSWSIYSNYYVNVATAA